MENCPVCHAPLAAAVCEACGFDPSCHYESFPTLAPITPGLAAVSARTEDQADLLRCAFCGSNTFHFRISARALQCARCSALRPVGSSPAPEAPSVGASDSAQKAELLRRLTSDLGSIARSNISGIINTTDRITRSEPKLSIPRQSVALGDWHTLVLRHDDTVYSTDFDQRRQTDHWKEIAAVAAGSHTSFGIRRDGTVLAAGVNTHGQCNTQSWTKIVSISANSSHTVGLRADGTVVATGNNYQGQCDIAHWTGITAVATGYTKTVGLRKDGTVVSTDKQDGSLQHWTDIAAIGVSASHVVGLRRDGTVVSTHDDMRTIREIARWRDIVSVAICDDGILALQKNGTVSAVFKNSKTNAQIVRKWTDIAAIAAGEHHFVGLRKNGTVVAVGKNSDKQCNVQNWRDIAAVYPGSRHTVGVHKGKYGALVAAGYNAGQCDLDGLTVRMD